MPLPRTVTLEGHRDPDTGEKLFTVEAATVDSHHGKPSLTRLWWLCVPGLVIFGNRGRGGLAPSPPPSNLLKLDVLPVSWLQLRTG